MRPQHRADPQAVHRPALQREKRDQALAGRWQLDGLVAAVNGESAQKVKRELFRHTLIVKRRDRVGMRSPLLVFSPAIADVLRRRFSRKNRAARPIASWIGLGCQPGSRSAFPWSSGGRCGAGWADQHADVVAAVASCPVRWLPRKPLAPITNFFVPVMGVKCSGNGKDDHVSEVDPQPTKRAGAHRVRRMSGRDPHEQHRVATPLELLFDLTFVVAFGIAASEFAHMLAEKHVGAGLLGFAFATFAICWAWINFSWFASAYDTDDWIYRLMTMLQMVGVIILALGFPQMYASIEHGDHVDNSVMVAGYVVMRIALVSQWLRAAKQDPDRRSACLTYVTFVTAAQIGWIGAIFLHTSVPVTVAVVVLLVAVEMLGPWLAERRKGGTPWHAHHISERYALLTIIALGEGVVGTVASLSAVIGAQGWSLDAVFVAVAGIGLTFGMWWTYFVVPQSDLLHAHRELSFRFGYLHLVVYGSIVATGAGLHAAAYYIEHHSKLGSVETVLSVALPVAAYIASVYLLYMLLLKAYDAFHLLLVALTAVVLAAAVLLANAGVSMAACLLVVMLAPMVTVVGYELLGHRHAAEAMATRLADGGD
jgi:low temperature requirement protein LtrA